MGWEKFVQPGSSSMVFGLLVDHVTHGTVQHMSAQGARL